MSIEPAESKTPSDIEQTDISSSALMREAQNYIEEGQIRRYFIVDKYGKIFIQDLPGGPMRPATVDETARINETLSQAGQPAQVIESTTGKPVTALTAPLRM